MITNARETTFGAVKAAIFDMDGVVTDTAEAHFLAWKEVFDKFLRERDPRAAPFTRREYLDHVDGIPRYNGVRRFLDSRGLKLPEGDADDMSADSICGLGNLKLERFRAWLTENTPPVFDDAVELITCLATSGIPVGIFSASRNAKTILESAHITGLFDVIMDGNEAAERGLAAKPDPAELIETVKKMGVMPQDAIVIEDAVAGVKAGARGHFRLVIGVDRHSDADSEQRFLLRANGADLVTCDLSRLVLPDRSGLRTLPRLPLVWDREPAFRAKILNRRLSIFLDYDGTLSPIVADYRKAVMPDGMAEAIRKLASDCPLAIISGRDLEDVRARVSVEHAIYAGSHGFDIAGPNGLAKRPDQATDFFQSINEAAEDLRAAIKDIKGAEIEHKTFAIAVHYRQVAASDVMPLEVAVDSVINQFEKLRKTRGKKVFQIQPKANWDKGYAIAWLLAETQLGQDGRLPIYIGDDLTDEDAFSALPPDGVSIAVRGDDRPTLADFTLQDPDDVRRFLSWLKNNNTVRTYL
jgi:trehalose 6-phosphate phosphatase